MLCAVYFVVPARNPNTLIPSRAVPVIKPALNDHLRTDYMGLMLDRIDAFTLNAVAVVEIARVLA